MIWSKRTRRTRKPKTERIRDPVHGLIVFDHQDPDASPTDQIAWQLLNTPEMQRLRRIRQLGLSEFTFPGATHSRFSHSVGVFHTARRLAQILRRNLPSHEWKADRAEVVIFAALLHDIGHGPFSHAFEVLQASRKAEKNHELWTAEIILRDGEIRDILENRRRGMADDVANLLRTEVPQDSYHAIVASSFDADRLDYLRRDRLMIGTGAGAIDFDWLMDNLRVAPAPLGADDDESLEEGPKTFCLHRKAQQAAESFLLARYHLFEQVYLHKTTRGLEQLLGALLREVAVAVAAAGGEPGRIGLGKLDPLITFFGPGRETIENYLALDDMAVWAAAAGIARGPEGAAKTYAGRLLCREPPRALDIQAAYPREPNETLEEVQKRWQTQIDRIDRLFEGEFGRTVFKDVAALSIYSEAGADQTKAHKRLMVLVNDSPHEITQLSDVIRTLQPKTNLVRYYFLDEATRDRAREGRT